MKKVISVLIISLIIFYIFFLKVPCYIKPEKWHITEENDKIMIMLGISTSFVKWEESFEIKGKDVYIRIYTVSYLNFLNQSGGTIHRVYIPKRLNEIEKIYTYDELGQPVLVYPKSNEQYPG